MLYAQGQGIFLQCLCAAQQMNANKDEALIHHAAASLALLLVRKVVLGYRGRFINKFSKEIIFAAISLARLFSVKSLVLMLVI